MHQLCMDGGVVRMVSFWQTGRQASGAWKRNKIKFLTLEILIPDIRDRY